MLKKFLTMMGYINPVTKRIDWHEVWFDVITVAIMTVIIITLIAINSIR